MHTATNRLYIFGRKNRKIFDKEHWWFFERLNYKIENGFDFKCLFLDPESPDIVIMNAHEDKDFKKQLEECIENAVNVLRKFKINRRNNFKKYKTLRLYSLVIADEAVLFKPIEVNEEGKAKRLTRSSFTLTSVKTSQGKNIEEYFNSIWEHSTPLS